MNFVIPRGIVYHRVIDDIFWMFQSLFSKLDDKSTIDEFEKKFATLNQRKHCIAFPFARTAIYFALKSRNLPSGSEVLMPPITIKAILDVVLALKLVPVFVDIDPETLCLDIDELKSAASDKTRAIIVTYLFGIVPNIEEMNQFCQEHGLFVIEDFSQCLNGSFEGKKLGSFGDVGIYSASSIKTLDTYGGGLAICDDDHLSELLRSSQKELPPPVRIQLIRKILTDLIRNLATSRALFHFVVFPILRLMNFFRPDSILKHTGARNQDMIDSLPPDWFSAYTSFQARIGLTLLRTLEQTDRERKENVEKIKSSVKSVNFPQGVAKGDNVYWQLVAYFDQPQAVQRYLHKHKVDTSTTSLEKISALSAYPYQALTPNADRLYANGLLIPAFPGLSDEDIQRIGTVLSHPDIKNSRGEWQ
jgi:perosamine synthetase